MTNETNRPATRLVTKGRDPEANHGFVNPPVYHASTVLYPSVEAVKARTQKYVYGRRTTPTTESLELAVADIEGGHATRLTPSGLAAISTALLSVVKTGDHVLVADTVYRPCRNFCDSVLSRLGIEVTYYDPLIGADVAALMKPNTRIVYTEAPGSQTFEMQDIPATAAAAHAGGAMVMMDNTWASPLFCDPFSLGVDVSIQAATKYIVGHSDAMLGCITANEECWPLIKKGHEDLGQCAGPDDIYLAQRGIRTLSVRLNQHMANGIALAQWLEERPEVDRVLHPALPSHPGHDIWKRDFKGASGLFSCILKPVAEPRIHAMLDGFELFGLGFSWGGYESLVVPFDPRPYRTATQWPHEGQGLRFHAGLEDMDDLKDELAEGFERLNATG